MLLDCLFECLFVCDHPYPSGGAAGRCAFVSRTLISARASVWSVRQLKNRLGTFRLRRLLEGTSIVCIGHEIGHKRHARRSAGTKMWKIENLLDMKQEGGRTFYLVAWMATDGDK